MDSPPSSTPSETARPYPATVVKTPKPFSPRSLFSSLRNQLISGLIFSLPIVITFWIIYWIFLTLERFLLNPVAALIHRIIAWMRNYPFFAELELPGWWYNIASPVLAIVLMLMILYMHGVILPVVGVPHARLVSTARADRRHDLQGGPQRGQFTGEPVPRGCRFQAGGPGAVSPSRNAIARIGDQLPARCDDRPNNPDGVRADRGDAAGGLHPVRAGRVGDEHCLERERDAAGHSVRRNHGTADHPFF